MRFLLSVTLVLVMAGSAAAQPKIDAAAAAVVVPPLPAGATVRPVALTRLKSQVRDDQNVGTLWYGVICIQPMPVTFKEVAKGLENLEDVFGEELKAAGFTPHKDPGGLFTDAEAPSSDLQVGALVKGVDASYCGSLISNSGKIKMNIEWQVYSTLRREVVATVETHETAQRRMGGRGQKRSLGQDAFAANVRKLLSDESFRAIVLAADSPDLRASVPGANAPIGLKGMHRDVTAIADAPGSVVAIFAGSGFGSGVLISSDGYLLTNQHVVGAAQTVRVRWSDGFEATGKVIRTDKRRDVALVQTEPRGRTPLALRRDRPTAGATVFAIGMPLDPKLQSTVTRGVVSANRVIDGFSFIQSDVPVTHGNSGGPLLDEKGAVLGLTNWGFRPGGESNNLNFFIPIGDALDFLSLKPAG